MANQNALERLIEAARADDPVVAGQAAIELVEIRSIIAELLTDYWRLEVPGNYIVCRYCGESAYRGMDIQHQHTCPVKRGRRFLNA